MSQYKYCDYIHSAIVNSCALFKNVHTIPYFKNLVIHIRNNYWRLFCTWNNIIECTIQLIRYQCIFAESIIKM